MSNLIVNMHQTQRASGARPRGPLVWRRKDRMMIKRLLALLKDVQRRDQRAVAAAEKVSGEPFLFVERFGGPIDTAVKRLVDKCSEALTDREW